MSTTIDPTWAALDAAGVKVRRDGDRLKFGVRGERPPITADELSILGTHKPTLLAWLASPVGRVVTATHDRVADPTRREMWLEQFDELAGHYEYDDGDPTREAEEAAVVVITEMQRREAA
jgi:hypothetical protein